METDETIGIHTTYCDRCDQEVTSVTAEGLCLRCTKSDYIEYLQIVFDGIRKPRRDQEQAYNMLEDLIEDIFQNPNTGFKVVK